MAFQFYILNHALKHVLYPCMATDSGFVLGIAARQERVAAAISGLEERLKGKLELVDGYGALSCDGILIIVACHCLPVLSNHGLMYWGYLRELERGGVSPSDNETGQKVKSLHTDC